MCRAKLARFLTAIENAKSGFGELTITLLAVVFARSLLEIFSNTQAIAHPSVFLLQFPIWYLAVFTGLSLVLSYTLKREIGSATKVLITFSFITLIPPIVDLVVGVKGGINYIYTTRDIQTPIVEPLKVYLTFFFNLWRLPSGVSPGIMVEAYFIVVLTFLYGVLANAGVIRSIAASILSYTLIYLFAIIPYLVVKLEFALKGLKILSPYSVLNIEQTCYIFLSLFIFLWALKARPQGIKDFLVSFRLNRLLHYFFMLVFGVFIGIGGVWANFRSLNYSKFFLLVLGLLWAEIGAVAVNDMYDIESDRINGFLRPLVKKTLTPEEARIIAVCSFFLALLGGLLVSYPALYFFFVILGFSFVYSAPPLRLKRVAILSTLVIAVLSLVVALLGYEFTNEYFPHPIINFPQKYILGILLIFTIAGNIKDIGEEAGDKAQGVFTLPVLLGNQRARFLIGGFVAISYIVATILLGASQYWILIAALFAIVNFLLVLKLPHGNITFYLYYIFFVLILLFR